MADSFRRSPYRKSGASRKSIKRLRSHTERQQVRSVLGSLADYEAMPETTVDQQLVPWDSYSVPRALTPLRITSPTRKEMSK